MMFLAPSIAGVIAFVIFPVFFALAMAFTNWDLTHREPLAFIGLDNFRRLLWGDESPRFWKSAINTLYLAMGVPVSIAGSLMLALMLAGPVGGSNGHARAGRKVMLGACGLGFAGVVILLMRGWTDAAFLAGLFFTICVAGAAIGSVFFRTLFYLPYFTSGVALFILWKHLYHPDIGPINAGLSFLIEHIQAIIPGISAAKVELPKWLSSVNNLWGMAPETMSPSKQFFGLGARDAILIMGIWCTIGGNNMLLFLAGLGNVPKDLYESAAIDGAGRWATFREVTWPHLAPTTFFILIISAMACFQGGFEQARVMTQGGPAGTTVTLGYQLYIVGFEEFRLGLASAISWIIFLITLIFTLAGWRFGNRYFDGEIES